MGHAGTLGKASGINAIAVDLVFSHEGIEQGDDIAEVGSSGLIPNHVYGVRIGDNEFFPVGNLIHLGRTLLLGASHAATAEDKHQRRIGGEAGRNVKDIGPIHPSEGHRLALGKHRRCY